MAILRICHFCSVNLALFHQKFHLKKGTPYYQCEMDVFENHGFLYQNIKYSYAIIIPLPSYSMLQCHQCHQDLGKGSSTIIICTDYCNSRKESEKLFPMVGSKKTSEIVINDGWTLKNIGKHGWANVFKKIIIHIFWPFWTIFGYF